MDCSWKLHCLSCGADYPGLDLRYRCECGGALEVAHDFSILGAGIELELFDRRRRSRAIQDRSGVWRFSEIVLPIEADEMISRPEGNTNLYGSKRVAAFAGLEELRLKHEGENPSGSFDDRGMTVAVSVSRKLGVSELVCAAHASAAASLAAYAAMAGMRLSVFIPAAEGDAGGVAQAVACGARTIKLAGDFPAACRLVERACLERDLRLIGPLDPFRREGLKSVLFELLQDLAWQSPDWIVLPGGRLDGCAGILKGLGELHTLGLIDGLPRLAVVLPAGAEPRDQFGCFTAIEKGEGAIELVGDPEVMDAKAQLDAAGIGADPASGTTVAGIRKLSGRGVIDKDARVCAILTGHLLKDLQAVFDYHAGRRPGFHPAPANPPVTIEAEMESILHVLD